MERKVLTYVLVGRYRFRNEGTVRRSQEMREWSGEDARRWRFYMCRIQLCDARLKHQVYVPLLF